MCGNTTSRDERGKKIKVGKEAKMTPLDVVCSVYSPQFFSVRRGWFVGSGSGVVTSSPAAAICPLLKASYRSSWFTTAPLKAIIYHVVILMCEAAVMLQPLKSPWVWTGVYFHFDASISFLCLDVYLLELMKTAVFFILLKKALSHRPWVSGVREQETTMKSLSDTRVSRGTVQERGEERRRNMRGRDQLNIITFSLLLSCPNHCFYVVSVSLLTLTKFSIHLCGVGLGCSPRVQQPLHSERHESLSDGHT